MGQPWLGPSSRAPLPSVPGAALVTLCEERLFAATWTARHATTDSHVFGAGASGLCLLQYCRYRWSVLTAAIWH